jgi:Zn finger protein HypA/HybF involved in hydrogenase expression
MWGSKYITCKCCDDYFLPEEGEFLCPECKAFMDLETDDDLILELTSQEEPDATRDI